MSRPTNQQLIDELRGYIRRCAIAHCTFMDMIPTAAKAEAEKEIQKRFDNWRESWIEPLIDDIEARLVKKPKAKR